VNQEKIVKI
jgi:hypothetical protein